MTRLTIVVITESLNNIPIINFMKSTMYQIILISIYTQVRYGFRNDKLSEN